ncbi:MAG: 50S ribosomal protein L13 [Candidatus Azosocius agrarius]|nr:MAG: 50S ribosomal protein L13 [Gammaproteobacteria bacterium]
MKTFVAKSVSVVKNWYVVDANKQILGRFASKIAMILMGKHKCLYTKHVDVGDYVIVINAKKIIVSGNKKHDKVYYSHSGYMGGLKIINFEKLLSIYPERVIFYAVKGMLPKTILGNKMLKKLKIYSFDKHIHVAQNPKMLEGF